ncbi:MAG: DUF4349 domain-containing protein [Oscillospiraceae bacterium]|nr:DUF4349 domain-containing protein [Oscillospiraceae bacterium]
MKKRVLFCLSILLLALLTACGGGARDEVGMAEPAMAPEMAAPILAEEAEFDDAWTYGTEVIGETGVGLGASVPIERLIYRAHTEVQTTEFDQAVDQVHGLLARHQGFVEQVNITGRDYHARHHDLFAWRTAQFTLRVPTASHDVMLRELDDLGATIYLFMEVENVSAQYADITSRLNALRVQEERIMALLEVADNMVDILELERRLSELILDIERLTSNRLHLDQQVAFSTVYLRLVEVHELTPPPVDPSFGQQIGNVFALQLRGMVQFFRDVVLTVIMLFPWLVLVAVATLPLVLLWRRSWRRKKRKLEEGE